MYNIFYFSVSYMDIRRAGGSVIIILYSLNTCNEYLYFYSCKVKLEYTLAIEIHANYSELYDLYEDLKFKRNSLPN